MTGVHLDHLLHAADRLDARPLLPDRMGAVPKGQIHVRGTPSGMPLRDTVSTGICEDSG